MHNQHMIHVLMLATYPLSMHAKGTTALNTLLDLLHDDQNLTG